MARLDGVQLLFTAILAMVKWRETLFRASSLIVNARRRTVSSS
jgi:hypothetical protein